MDTYISPERAACAYLLAVTCATIVFVTGNELWLAAFAHRYFSVRFGVATLGLAWVLAFIAALLPYAASITLANYRGIASGKFFIYGAVATALTFLPVLACAYPVGHLLRLAPMLCLAGLAAGTAAWRCIQRQGSHQR